jgi:hypothetical protein
MSNNMTNTKVHTANNIDELILELQKIKATSPDIKLGYENPVPGTGINFNAGYHIVTTTLTTSDKVEHRCVFLR